MRRRARDRVDQREDLRQIIRVTQEGGQGATCPWQVEAGKHENIEHGNLPLHSLTIL
jgi:hypothetical protein